MSETIAEKMRRIIREKDLHIKSKDVKHLTIYDLRQSYYDKFINFLKLEVPNQQGYDGLMILLEVYDRHKIADKLITKLEEEIVELKKKIEGEKE